MCSYISDDELVALCEALVKFADETVTNTALSSNEARQLNAKEYTILGQRDDAPRQEEVNVIHPNMYVINVLQLVSNF